MSMWRDDDYDAFSIEDAIPDLELTVLDRVRAVLGIPFMLGAYIFARPLPLIVGPNVMDRITEYFYEKLGIVRESDWGYECRDCGRYGHGYMLEDDVWAAALSDEERRKDDPESDGYDPLSTLIICLPCVEKRLGRRLVPEDFTNVPLNRPVLYGFGADTTPREDNQLT